MLETAVRWIAAAAFGLWAVYSVVLLISTGVFWMPGGKLGVGLWREAADAPGMATFAMALYLLAPLVVLFLPTPRKE